jgi:hypothetical protein
MEKYLATEEFNSLCTATVKFTACSNEAHFGQGVDTNKIVPISTEEGIPLIHQPMVLHPKELAGCCWN